MTEELFAVCVLWWAVGVVAIMLAWVFLIHCGAAARRLAVIMHRIWVDGTEFRWTRETAAA